MFRHAGWSAALLLGLACASARAQERTLPVGSPHEVRELLRTATADTVWASGTGEDDLGELRAVSFATPGPDFSVAQSKVFVFEPFDECLVSWNARHSKSTGFGVEISVARSADGPFSPWMWIGEWNVSQRPTAPVLAYEDARIDVDSFTSTSTWRALRVRVRGRSNDRETAGLSIDRMTLMPTLRSARSSPQKSTAAIARLDVPFRSQRSEDEAIASRICSPTSLAMVLAWHGVDAGTAEVARRAYDPFHDIYGNWNRAIQTAYSFGVPGRLERIVRWERAEELLARHQPLILSIAAKPGQLRNAPYASTAGHLLVLCGFDEAGNALVNDPAAPTLERGRLAYACADLEQVWIARGGTAYVLEGAPGKLR